MRGRFHREFLEFFELNDAQGCVVREIVLTNFLWNRLEPRGDQDHQTIKNTGD